MREARPADRWIECECPTSGVDFDRHDVASPDLVVNCSECGGSHRLGDIGHLLEAIDGEVGTSQLSEETWRRLAKERDLDV
jgi:hypothetical protein